MNFKTHLIIVSVIIITLYFARSLFMAESSNAPQTIEKSAARSPYFINIVRASWGLNCIESLKYMNEYSEGREAGYNAGNSIDFSKVKENNVLTAVSNICNDKSSCVFPIDISALGEDPLPSCGNKVLQVDYRCFSVDKLRSANEISGGNLSVDCDKQLKE